MKPIFFTFAVVALATVVLSSSRARAEDDPALPDGGSILTSTDGGPCAVVDTGSRGPWNMVIRCEGAQSPRYKLCTTSTCAPTAINQLLDSDERIDVPVNQTPGFSQKRYLGICTDDGGIPFCKVQVFH